MAAPPSPPTSYGVLLYPGFEVLDVAGPIECLNTLVDNLPNTSLTLSVIGRPIDHDHPQVPMPLTPANPGDESSENSNATNNFKFKATQIYQPSHTFDTAPPLDVLIIGGGWGSFPMERVEPEMAFLKKVFPSLRYLFTVCTGSAIAAKAGLLDGLRATSNKANWKDVVECGPKTHWVAQARWVVSDKVWTSSGVSAGTDGMIAFLKEIYPEEQHPGLVQAVIDNMEYRWESDCSNDPFAAVFGAQDVPPQI
ncbi:DJ-1/PfpI family protein [Pochonia chlamydosporia 170]|uniref:DJ-1/PfpI family protein n=1 Tax=Pochonia chlamydosporia 170 TaxID=1380566 RepID=A0A179FC61_METCM|nr:DJ-1/PfpI family protein [Pochonia chlamydosporia 170]OAQ62880.1 DJ-1/PfpI family protein [Pochonia chlamydosporia 170]